MVRAFQAAGDRRSHAAYECKNGQDHGIGLVVHIPGADSGHRIFSGLHASQDTASAEQRAWLCLHATGELHACTTHLASTSLRVLNHELRNASAAHPEVGAAVTATSVSSVHLTRSTYNEVLHSRSGLLGAIAGQSASLRYT